MSKHDIVLGKTYDRSVVRIPNINLPVTDKHISLLSILKRQSVMLSMPP